MSWYGKYEDENNVPPSEKKKEDEEVRLIARYLNKDDEPPEKFDVDPKEKTHENTV